MFIFCMHSKYGGRERCIVFQIVEHWGISVEVPWSVGIFLLRLMENAAWCTTQDHHGILDSPPCYPSQQGWSRSSARYLLETPQQLLTAVSWPDHQHTLSAVTRDLHVQLQNKATLHATYIALCSMQGFLKSQG